MTAKKDAKKDAEKVICPTCGRQMVLRKGTYGEFYGCTGYYSVPRCTTTRPKGWKPAATTQNITPSSEQEAILSFLSDPTKKHLVVKALAGTGKTTTLIMSMKAVKGSVLGVAYNKHIQEHFKNQLPDATIVTCHSQGFAAIRAAFPGVTVDKSGDKVKSICKELIQDDDAWYARNVLAQVVSLAKSTLVDAKSLPDLEEMCYRYSIDLNGFADVILPLVHQALSLCAIRTATIDFDDMVWLPVALNLPVQQYDWVFIDEYQDYSKCMTALTMRAVKPTGRIVAVGDENQAIYGFRGANTEAMREAIETLNAAVLPLNTTRRCPLAVVREAQRIVPEFTAADGAKEGSVSRSNQGVMRAHLQDGDLVLCRVNAPLVPVAYSLIKRGVKAVIRGRDIGKGLLSLIDKLKPSSIVDLASKLRDYRYKEVERLQTAGKDAAVQTVHEKCDTLNALMEGMRDLSELRVTITTIFDDESKTGVILSSIHRAKGDEAKRVWIMHPELLPHPKAVQPWQREQESHLEYVAITRSLDELIWVD